MAKSDNAYITYAEAVSLIGSGGGGPYVPLSGGSMTGVLSVSDYNYGAIKVYRTNPSGGAFILYYPRNQSTNFWGVGAGNDGTFAFEFDDVTVAKMTSDGGILTQHIGIGHTNEINSFSDSLTETGNDNLWLNYRSSGNVILCYGGGNAGIGTMNSVSYKLDVDGTIRSTGDQIISSDETKKENLQPLTHTVEDIASARAVSFDWKDGHGHSAGSIAQDWKDIAPEFVHGEEGDMTLSYAQLGLANSVIIAKDVVAIKDENKRLKEEISEIKEMLAKLLEKK